MNNSTIKNEGKLSLKEIKDFLGVDEGVEIAKVSITPEQAQCLLAFNNDHNRKISDKTVNSFTKIFNDGKYNMTNDNISFDVDGSISNGQHRLMGLARSKVSSIEIGVTFGIPITMAMDIGRKRTVGDNLLLFDDLDGFLTSKEMADQLAGIVKTYVCFSTGQFIVRELSDNQILDIMRFFKKDLEICWNAGLFKKNKKFSANPVLAALFGAYLNGISINVLSHIKETLPEEIIENPLDRPIGKLHHDLLHLKGGGRDLIKIRYCETCACIHKIATKSNAKRVTLSKSKIMYPYSLPVRLLA